MHRRSSFYLARYLAAAPTAPPTSARSTVADTAPSAVPPLAPRVEGARDAAEVTLGGVLGLYGLDIRIGLDSTLLETRHADPGEDGAQEPHRGSSSRACTARDVAGDTSETTWQMMAPLSSRAPHAAGDGPIISTHPIPALSIAPCTDVCPLYVRPRNESRAPESISVGE